MSDIRAYTSTSCIIYILQHWLRLVVLYCMYCILQYYISTVLDCIGLKPLLLSSLSLSLLISHSSIVLQLANIESCILLIHVHAASREVLESSQVK